jgi:hypothetical protein
MSLEDRTYMPKSQRPHVSIIDTDLVDSDKESVSASSDSTLCPPTPPGLHVLDDTNILNAISSGLNPSLCISPGFEFADSQIVTVGGSSEKVVRRSPNNFYERVAFTFLRDSRDLQVFNTALLASCLF